jgi:hypothetical protein
MKKFTSYFVTISAATLLLAGCATYHASPLSDGLLISESQSNNTANSLQLKVKAFNKSDCKKYLGSNVISKGYRPLQLSILNDTDKNYLFALRNVSLPSERPEVVASKVHSGTLGSKIAGVGIGVALTPIFLTAPFSPRTSADIILGIASLPSSVSSHKANKTNMNLH